MEGVMLVFQCRLSVSWQQLILCQVIADFVTLYTTEMTALAVFTMHSNYPVLCTFKLIICLP